MQAKAHTYVHMNVCTQRKWRKEGREGKSFLKIKDKQVRGTNKDPIRLKQRQRDMTAHQG